MKKFNSSKLISISKVLLALSLSVLSMGSNMAYSVNTRENMPSVGRSDSMRQRGGELHIGMRADNPRFENLTNQIGYIREIDRERLVPIFETDFLPIILRDGMAINLLGVTQNLKIYFLNNLNLWTFMDGATPQHDFNFINVLWAGSSFILLNEGRDGIERMEDDFRNWNSPNIGLNDLLNYFVQRTRRQ